MIAGVNVTCQRSHREAGGARARTADLRIRVTWLEGEFVLLLVSWFVCWIVDLLVSWFVG